MSIFLMVGDAFTPPPAVWPAEWVTFTNITREGYASDYGTQIYSWKNRAQLVLHSDWFAYSDDDHTKGKGSMLWIDDIAYRLGNNNQECCLLDQYEFTMPNVDWTDLLAYEYTEIMNGIPCYVYTNHDMMDAKYWQSIESGLPIAWSNTPDPKNPAPIVQYFFSSVVYKMPLPSSYFMVPTVCETAVSCPDDSPSTMTSTSNYIEDGINSSSNSGSISMSCGVFSVICTSLLVLGASSTYFFQLLCQLRKPAVNNTNQEKESKEIEDDSMTYKLLAGAA